MPAAWTLGCGRRRCSRYPVCIRSCDATCAGAGNRNGRSLPSPLHHLGLRKAALIGSSLGGRTAIDVALDHSELVSSLVFVGAGLAGFEFSLDYQQMMVSILGPLALGNTTSYVAAFLDSALGARSEESQPLVAQMLVDNQRLFSGDAAFLVPSEPPASSRLPEIHVPTLVMTGAEDHPDILEIARILATGIAGAERQTVPGAAHMVSLDAPDEFNRIVLRFLATHPVA
ncbi:MAG: alpha/beta hydrolase [Acidobacteriota bacterium]